jgi:predicted amidophosphoribosyltransferase
MASIRMPRYDVRNDGAGPYAVFYCELCDREYRSQPDVKSAVTREVGREAAGGLLRNIPFVGSVASSMATREDPRYSQSMTPQQLEAAWQQVEANFRLCPTCGRVVCLPDFDVQAGYCREDSPRKAEIAQAEAEQAAGAVKGFVSALGLGAVFQGVGQAARQAQASMARCPQDGTVAPAGTKFCPNCGSPMVQPVASTCPKCGAQVGEAKFCPQCGAKIEQPAATPAVCPKCGANVAGVKFCPSCGTKVG